jgi:hypothetical protein
MKRILDPSFRYRPNFATDLRKTFERVRRERHAQIRERATSETEGCEKVLQINRSTKPR